MHIQLVDPTGVGYLFIIFFLCKDLGPLVRSETVDQVNLSCLVLFSALE
jgi:hypothetical protein